MSVSTASTWHSIQSVRSHFDVFVDRNMVYVFDIGAFGTLFRLLEVQVIRCMSEIIAVLADCCCRSAEVPQKT